MHAWRKGLSAQYIRELRAPHDRVNDSVKVHERGGCRVQAPWPPHPGSATAQRATIYSESTTVSSHEMKGVGMIDQVQQETVVVNDHMHVPIYYICIPLPVDQVERAIMRMRTTSRDAANANTLPSDSLRAL